MAAFAADPDELACLHPRGRPARRGDRGGCELRQTLGTAAFSGMIGPTIFGLIFTPAFYVLCSGIVGRSQRRERAGEAGAPHPQAAE